MIQWAQSRLGDVVLPRLAGVRSVTMSLDELGVPANLRQPDPPYDNRAGTVAANLAGGLGSSDAGPDQRHLDGKLTFEKFVDDDNRLWCTIQVRGEFEWIVNDGIDFCPGNAGNSDQEYLTIPLSRLEASGVARDLGIDVRFQRSRAEVLPGKFPNPDVQK